MAYYSTILLCLCFSKQVVKLIIYCFKFLLWYLFVSLPMFINCCLSYNIMKMLWIAKKLTSSSYIFSLVSYLYRAFCIWVAQKFLDIFEKYTKVKLKKRRLNCRIKSWKMHIYVERDRFSF